MDGYRLMGFALKSRDPLEMSLETQREVIERFVRESGYSSQGAIAEDMTFRQWCEDLAEKGLMIENRPFSLRGNDALEELYDEIPTTLDEAKGFFFALMKAAQIGATVWEILAQIYIALKFGPLTSGMFLPDQATAAFKSENRFMRMVRTMPESIYHKFIYQVDHESGKDKRTGEGNVLTRKMGNSLFLFLWTSGKVSTESRPMDILGLDEVQGMTLEQIGKVKERISASMLKMLLLLSTANLPDLDIDFYYKRGTQKVFFTKCEACGGENDLSDPDKNFPGCIAYNTGQVDGGAPLNEYVYVCPDCGHYIPNTMHGRFVEQNPGADYRSMLFPQTISSTVTAREMITDWKMAVTGDQKKNYYNRKLARAYVDQDQVPVKMEHCDLCVQEGIRAGVKWEQSGRDTYMGIDQMGGFHAVIIKKRLSDGRQAVIHAEAIFSDDPWEKSGKLMNQYGVAVCVLEHLPNWDNAKAFANKFPGRVFIVTSYGEDQILWADTVSRSDRKTGDEERSRYTCSINQYKAMQTSLFRVKNQVCLFPKPEEKEQDVIDKGERKRIVLLRDWVFMHFTKTALIVETADDRAKTAAAKQRSKARDSRAYVAKLGVDPHFSYANMLCDVAWARSHGTSTFWFPEKSEQEKVMDKVQKNMPGLPPNIVQQMERPPAGDVCGVCEAFDKDASRCKERDLRVKADDPGCMFFIRDEYADG